MMHKIVTTDSYDFGEPAAELIKISSNGVTGADLRQFLKRASHSFANDLSRIKFAKDELPIHVIAIGSSEKYGANRNGDLFSEAALRKHHGDFVKHARVYQNHQNKDPKKSYGVIKASTYNDDMHRVELLLAINGSKEAAERNGGLYDSKQVDRILSGKDFSGSMACSTNGWSKVLTSTGDKPISEVKIGDWVLTHKMRWRQVTGLNRRRYTGYTLSVSYGNDYGDWLGLTADHMLKAMCYDRSGRNSFEWVHAAHLQEGDLLMPTAFDKRAWAHRISWISKDFQYDIPTWNIEVDEDESYILGGVVSHNCKVSYDVCNSCNNKARTRAEYCDEDSCIGPRGEKRGGCKHHLTKVCEDGHILGVDNPEPNFFDFSDVRRPADRIAYGGIADYLQKAASAGEVIGGAALAEAWGITSPMSLNSVADKQYAMARKLAAVEVKIAENLTDKYKASRLQALSLAFMPAQIHAYPAHTKEAEALTALAGAKAVLPLSTFLSWQNKSEKTAEVAERLPGVYTRMIESDGFYPLLDSYAYAPQPTLPSAAARSWAQKCASVCSIEPQAAECRVVTAALHDQKPRELRKTSSIRMVGEPERLAWQYGMYKLAILTAMDPNDRELELAVLQNYV